MCSFWNVLCFDGRRPHNRERYKEHKTHSLHITKRGSAQLYTFIRNNYALISMRAEFSLQKREEVQEYIDWAWLRDWLNELPAPDLREHTNFSPIEEL
jgi:hypothetical protein